MIRLLYKTILRLYPARYQAEFSQEMLDVFDRASAEQTAHFAFGLREIAGLVAGAMRVWLARAPHADELQGSYRARMVAAIAAHDFIAARRYCELDQQERDQLGL